MTPAVASRQEFKKRDHRPPWSNRAHNNLRSPATNRPAPNSRSNNGSRVRNTASTPQRARNARAIAYSDRARVRASCARQRQADPPNVSHVPCDLRPAPVAHRQAGDGGHAAVRRLSVENHCRHANATAGQRPQRQPPPRACHPIVPVSAHRPERRLYERHDTGGAAMPRGRVPPVSVGMSTSRTGGG